jgi:hypothetical protein
MSVTVAVRLVRDRARSIALEVSRPRGRDRVEGAGRR